MAYLQQYEIYLTLGALAIALICIIFTAIAVASAAGWKRKMKRWTSIHSSADLEEVYARTLKQVDQLRQEVAQVQSDMQELREQVRRKISTAKIVRYNAFADTGSDLSFSVALLDDYADGVVISSIYGRDESRTYAKPVASGTSSYTLTEEEQTVIHGESMTAPVKRSTRV
ncbi:hypothetical protein GCM10025857_21120 [Alicyclobacillus contaminans]|uniref:DUF4446 family protein n=1 Tax=Alicyclobacillus contaminans TaxID=392016 RepID=UPI0004099FCC|nr:DUF4446 family protein [Alicyclobacillus contaminans]GMA50755.1 hypothetical protein GCM10025857_21120 [Alicyclobacillus contaminans]